MAFLWHGCAEAVCPLRPRDRVGHDLFLSPVRGQRRAVIRPFATVCSHRKEHSAGSLCPPPNGVAKATICLPRAPGGGPLSLGKEHFEMIKSLVRQVLQGCLPLIAVVLLVGCASQALPPAMDADVA